MHRPGIPKNERSQTMTWSGPFGWHTWTDNTCTIRLLTTKHLDFQIIPVHKFKLHRDSQPAENAEYTRPNHFCCDKKNTRRWMTSDGGMGFLLPLTHVRATSNQATMARLHGRWISIAIRLLPACTWTYRVKASTEPHFLLHSLSPCQHEQPRRISSRRRHNQWRSSLDFVPFVGDGIGFTK